MILQLRKHVVFSRPDIILKLSIAVLAAGIDLKM